MPDEIGGPANWLAEDLRDPDEWVIRLSGAQIEAIDAALHAALAAGLTLPTLTREGFPLDGLEDLIADVHRRLEDGRGLVVLRGLPAHRYTPDALRMIFWGLGKHLGTAVSQSSRGDLLGDVRHLGSDVNSSTGRGYMSNQHLIFHTDTCDVVALMVLQVALRGGESMIASSVAVRNEIARTRPDLLAELYRPVFWSWKGQQAEGAPGYYPQPIYSEFDGKFSSRDIQPHVFAAYADFPSLPPLSAVQIEAVQRPNLIASDPRFHIAMMFEPGDIQLLNNHVTLHARTAFEDHPEPHRKRHLLRMWLSVPNSRTLSPAMSAIYRDQRGGAVRGGFPSRTGTHSFATVQAQD